MEDVVSEGDFLQLGFAVGIGQGKIGDSCVLDGNNVNRGKAHGLVGEGIQYGCLDFRHPFLEHVVIDDDNLGPGSGAKADCRQNR